MVVFFETGICKNCKKEIVGRVYAHGFIRWKHKYSNKLFCREKGEFIAEPKPEPKK